MLKNSLLLSIKENPEAFSGPIDMNTFKQLRQLQERGFVEFQFDRDESGQILVFSGSVKLTEKGLHSS